MKMDETNIRHDLVFSLICAIFVGQYLINPPRRIAELLCLVLFSVGLGHCVTLAVLKHKGTLQGRTPSDEEIRRISRLKAVALLVLVVALTAFWIEKLMR